MLLKAEAERTDSSSDYNSGVSEPEMKYRNRKWNFRIWHLQQVHSNSNTNDFEEAEQKVNITYLSGDWMSFSLDQPLTKNQILNSSVYLYVVVAIEKRGCYINKHLNLVFSIWFLVNGWSNEKDRSLNNLKKWQLFMKIFFLKNDCPLCTECNAMLNHLTTTISRVSKNMKISSLIHHKRNYFIVSSSGEKQVSFSHSLLFSAWIAFEWQWSKVHSQICNHYNICMQ